MYCLITRRKAKHKPIFSGVYRNAVWEPIFPGSDDFCFSGQEILRTARCQYRIALQKSVSENGHRRRRVWPLAMIDYWEIVDDYLDTLRTPWHRQASVWGLNEGRIVEGLRHHFPHLAQGEYRRYLSLVMAKFSPIKTQVIEEYRKSEEYPLQRKRINGEARTVETDRPRADAAPREEPRRSGKGARFDRVMAGLVSFRSIPNKALAREIVVAGYRRVALRRHPDRGGDAEAMQELTELKNRMMELLEE